jgi:hypothetical protein
MSHRDFFSKTALKIKLSKDGLVPNKNSQNIALNCQLDGRKGPIFLSGPFPSIQRTHVCNFLGPDFFKKIASCFFKYYIRFFLFIVG